jgi:hypothetical protein
MITTTTMRDEEYKHHIWTVLDRSSSGEPTQTDIDTCEEPVGWGIQIGWAYFIGFRAVGVEAMGLGWIMDSIKSGPGKVDGDICFSRQKPATRHDHFFWRHERRSAAFTFCQLSM